MKKLLLVGLSLSLFACDAEDAALSDLSSDQLSAVCGEGTVFSVETRTCAANLSEGLEVNEEGAISVDPVAQQQALDAARAEGAASVEQIACGEGTNLDESAMRCRPTLGSDVALNSETLLVEPTESFADARFADGVASVSLITCADGTSLDDSGLSCAPNLSADVEISESEIVVKSSVTDASFAQGVASVQVVTCAVGTAMNAGGTECEASLSADVAIGVDGLVYPTDEFAASARQNGIDSVTPITCDDNTGVILNGEGTSCVARLSIDVVFDGQEIIPTEGFRQAAYDEGRDAIDVVSCGSGTTLSNNLKCDPNLGFSVSLDFGTGELYPSDDFRTAAQDCGVTAANDPSEMPMTVYLNETGDGYDCRIIEEPKVALFASGLDFDGAEADCVSRGGHLAWIEDEAMNSNLIGLCGAAPAEVEACLIGAESPFTSWTEGSGIDYVNWAQASTGLYGALTNARGANQGEWLQVNEPSGLPYLCRFTYPGADLSNALTFIEL
jgi:hypothetical protein